MLSLDQINQEAKLLDQAEKTRLQIAATTTRHPDMSIDDAYAIQAAWMEIKKAEGKKIAGHKIGLTSRTMQRSMGIDSPDSGIILDDMVFEKGSELLAANFLDPRIEVELAFVLKSKLEGKNISIDEVLNATDYIIPAVELIAARSYRVHPDTKYVRNVKDTISDNAANAGIIVGGTAISPDTTDLRWIGAMLYKNGILEETGLAAGVLDHPANGIAWLAERYTEHNIPLEAGLPILAGSFTSPIFAHAGDNFLVDFGKFGSFDFKFI